MTLLQTRTKHNPPNSPLASGSLVAVAGGGIAALSACLALKRAGYKVLRLCRTDPPPPPCLPPRALVCPRLRRRGAGGREAQFLEQAYLKAQTFYSSREISRRGAVRIAQKEQDELRMRALAEDYPTLCHFREGEELEILTGIPNARLLSSCGLFFPDALLLDTTRGLLEKGGEVETCPTRLRAYNFDQPRGCYRLFGDKGRGELPFSEVRALVLAVGSELPSWLPSMPRGILQTTRGRIDGCLRRELKYPPRLPICASGWIVPEADRVLVVRGLAPSRESCAKRENFARLNSWCGAAEIGLLLSSLIFTATRLSTKDRLPLLGRLSGGEGVYVFGALGGHGFLFAPLMAELLVRSLQGAPAPELLDPRRFAL